MNTNSLSRGQAILRLSSGLMVAGIVMFAAFVGLALASSATGVQAAADQKLAQPVALAPQTLAWRVVTPVTNIDLIDVHMVSATDGWAVGGSTANGTTVVLHYDGTNWSVVETGMQGVLVDVFMLSSTNGYVLSRIGAQGGRIYHYDGVSWTLVYTTDVTPNRASGVAPDNIWVSGLGKIYHWDGVQWTTPYVHPTLRNLFAIQMVSPTEGWVTGAGSTETGAGTILHYLNGTWSEYLPSPAPQTLYDCFFRTSTDGWAVGTAGESYVVHYDGNQWAHLYSFQFFLDRIWINSPTDGWAIGQNNIAHYDGTGFTPITYPSTLWTSSIFMLSSTDGWIVGEGGLMLRYSDDATPTPIVTPTFTSEPTFTPTFTVVSTSTSTRTPVPPTSTPVAGTATATACAITFTDVPEGHTFYSNVRCLACRGIISGYEDGTFKPDNLVTRGQLAKIVSNAARFTEDPGTQIYQDVPSTNPFYEWINRLSRRGYMSGYTCGSPGEPCIENRPYFRPFANATRAQTSKIVANAAQYTETPTEQTFEDVPPSHPFYVEIQRLASRGIMGGYQCGGVGEPCMPGSRPYFRPYNNVTRGQSAKIVANTFYPECQTP